MTAPKSNDTRTEEHQTPSRPSAEVGRPALIALRLGVSRGKLRRFLAARDQKA